MPAETVRVSVEGPVASITLDRPPVNAVDRPTYARLREVFQDFATRGDLSVVILRGAGRGFSAGADLKEISKAEHGGPVGRVADSLWPDLYDLPQCVICVIHGFAIGGALAFSSLSDIRVASDEAIFAAPQITRGISVNAGGSIQRRLGIPTGKLRELVLTGRNFTAREALQMNLVDYVVSRGDLDAKVSEIVENVVRHGPMAVQMNKRALNAAESANDWSSGFDATRTISREFFLRSEAHAKASQFLDSGS
jgi:enoyl-CoA hydratase/carnithine racemase